MFGWYCGYRRENNAGDIKHASLADSFLLSFGQKMFWIKECLAGIAATVEKTMQETSSMQVWQILFYFNKSRTTNENEIFV